MGYMLSIMLVIYACGCKSGAMNCVHGRNPEPRVGFRAYIWLSTCSVKGLRAHSKVSGAIQGLCPAYDALLSHALVIIGTNCLGALLRYPAYLLNEMQAPWPFVVGARDSIAPKVPRRMHLISIRAKSPRQFVPHHRVGILVGLRARFQGPISRQRGYSQGNGVTLRATGLLSQGNGVTPRAIGLCNIWAKSQPGSKSTRGNSTRVELIVDHGRPLTAAVMTRARLCAQHPSCRHRNNSVPLVRPPTLAIF